MEHQRNLKRKHESDNFFSNNGKTKNHYISDANVITQESTIETVNEMDYEVVEVNSNTYREVMQKTIMEETSFGCNYCQNKFPSNNQLVQHKLNVHANIRKNMAFEHNYSLPTGQVKISKPQFSQFKLKDHSVQCKECNIFFESFYQLTRHTQRSHSTEVGHRCHGCSKLFLTFIELEDHGINFEKMECHAHQKKEFCGTCRVSFLNKRQFDEHFAIKHDRFKPVICSICEKKFNSRSEVKTHSLKMHKMNCIHDCSKCTFTYPMKKALLLHEASIHKDDVVPINGSVYSYQEIKLEPIEDYQQEMPQPKRIKTEINGINQEVLDTELMENYPYQEIKVEDDFDPDDFMSLIVDESEPLMNNEEVKLDDFDPDELFSMIVKEEPTISSQSDSNGVVMEDFEMELEKTSKTFKIWNKPGPQPNGSTLIPPKPALPTVGRQSQWCNLCLKFFPDLTEHTKTVHAQKIKYKCPYCMKMFNVRKVLQHHIAQNPDCSKSNAVLQKGIIIVHIREVDSLPCQLCPKRFNTVAMFEAHMKFSHSDKKVFIKFEEKKPIKVSFILFKFFFIISI